MLTARSLLVSKKITPMTTIREQETPGNYNKNVYNMFARENTMIYQTNEISNRKNYFL